MPDQATAAGCPTAGARYPDGPEAGYQVQLTYLDGIPRMNRTGEATRLTPLTGATRGGHVDITDNGQ